MWAGSSSGKSIALMRRRLVVRVHPSLPGVFRRGSSNGESDGLSSRGLGVRIPSVPPDSTEREGATTP